MYDPNSRHTAAAQRDDRYNDAEDVYADLAMTGWLDNGTVAVLRRHFLQVSITEVEAGGKASIRVAELASIQVGLSIPSSPHESKRRCAVSQRTSTSTYPNVGA